MTIFFARFGLKRIPLFLADVSHTFPRQSAHPSKENLIQSVKNKYIFSGDNMFSNLLQLPLRWPRLKHVRYGDGGISVGEVRVVPPPADGDAEAVPGDAAQLHVVELPGDPLAALQGKKQREDGN